MKKIITAIVLAATVMGTTAPATADPRSVYCVTQSGGIIKVLNYCPMGTSRI